MNTTSNEFVVVTEDLNLVATVRSAMAGLAELHVVSGLNDVFGLSGLRSMSGVIVDARAVSGSPNAQLGRLRAENPLVNVLFVANELRASLLNDLQPLRVELVARPLPQRCFEDFVQRTLSAGRLSSAQVDAWIEHLTLAHKLNGTDIALFPLLLERETKEEVCARLRIDQDTLSRDLRRLVKKCRVRNTDRLAKNLMRDALLLGNASQSTYAPERVSA